MRAWYLFWRISANDCFCTGFSPLFYFIYSTFFLIITATAVNISDVCFYFKEFKSGFSFSLKSLSLLLFHFSMSFLSFSVFFHFFLSLLIKRILLSWELIKMFLPPLTSLKYVHVSIYKAIYILCKWCWNVSFGRKKKFIFVNRVVESHSVPIKAR